MYREVGLTRRCDVLVRNHIIQSIWSVLLHPVTLGYGLRPYTDFHEPWQSFPLVERSQFLIGHDPPILVRFALALVLGRGHERRHCVGGRRGGGGRVDVHRFVGHCGVTGLLIVYPGRLKVDELDPRFIRRSLCLLFSSSPDASRLRHVIALQMVG
jgi:hypothetical protein